MKKYIDGIGYIEVKEFTEVRYLPPEAVYYYSDAEYNYYITAIDDVVYAVKA